MKIVNQEENPDKRSFMKEMKHKGEDQQRRPNRYTSTGDSADSLDPSYLNKPITNLIFPLRDELAHSSQTNFGYHDSPTELRERSQDPNVLIKSKENGQTLNSLWDTRMDYRGESQFEKSGHVSNMPRENNENHIELLEEKLPEQKEPQNFQEVVSLKTSSAFPQAKAIEDSTAQESLKAEIIREIVPEIEKEIKIHYEAELQKNIERIENDFEERLQMQMEAFMGKVQQETEELLLKKGITNKRKREIEEKVRSECFEELKEQINFELQVEAGLSRSKYKPQKETFNSVANREQTWADSRNSGPKDSLELEKPKNRRVLKESKSIETIFGDREKSLRFGEEEFAKEIAKREKVLGLNFKKKLEEAKKALEEQFRLEFEKKFSEENAILEQKKAEIARMRAGENLKKRKMEEKIKNKDLEVSKREKELQRTVESLKQEIFELNNERKKSKNVQEKKGPNVMDNGSKMRPNGNKKYIERSKEKGNTLGTMGVEKPAKAIDYEDIRMEEGDVECIFNKDQRIYRSSEEMSGKIQGTKNKEDKKPQEEKKDVLPPPGMLSLKNEGASNNFNRGNLQNLQTKTESQSRERTIELSVDELKEAQRIFSSGTNNESKASGSCSNLRNSEATYKNQPKVISRQESLPQDQQKFFQPLPKNSPGDLGLKSRLIFQENPLSLKEKVKSPQAEKDQGRGLLKLYDSSDVAKKMLEKNLKKAIKKNQKEAEPKMDELGNKKLDENARKGLFERRHSGAMLFEQNLGFTSGSETKREESKQQGKPEGMSRYEENHPSRVESIRTFKQSYEKSIQSTGGFQPLEKSKITGLVDKHLCDYFSKDPKSKKEPTKGPSRSLLEIVFGQDLDPRSPSGFSQSKVKSMKDVRERVAKSEAENDHLMPQYLAVESMVLNALPKKMFLDKNPTQRNLFVQDFLRSFQALTSLWKEIERGYASRLRFCQKLNGSKTDQEILYYLELELDHLQEVKKRQAHIIEKLKKREMLKAQVLNMAHGYKKESDIAEFNKSANFVMTQLQKVGLEIIKMIESYNRKHPNETILYKDQDPLEVRLVLAFVLIEKGNFWK